MFVFSECSFTVFRIAKHLRKQENMTHTEEKKEPMEIDLEVTLILELADKNFKADVATAEGY